MFPTIRRKANPGPVVKGVQNKSFAAGLHIHSVHLKSIFPFMNRGSRGLYNLHSNLRSKPWTSSPEDQHVKAASSSS